MFGIPVLPNVQSIITPKIWPIHLSSYVEAKDNREVIDITKLNMELKTTVAKIDRLRADIDAIVAAIEGVGIKG